jgi:hypothetical protein
MIDSARIFSYCGLLSGSNVMGNLKESLLPLHHCLRGHQLAKSPPVLTMASLPPGQVVCVVEDGLPDAVQTAYPM